MIVVTGAAGFIGSHVVERLLAEGIEVVGIDNFDPFYDRLVKEANLAAFRTRRGFSLIEVDIRDDAALAAGLARVDGKIDAIVHLAAKAGVRASIGDPVRYHEVNVNGTVHLLEWARQRAVPQFVFASSSSVYGVNPRVPWREDDRDLQPISPYASTKLAGEMTGHVYASLFGIRFVALRFFTVFGPRQRPDLAVAKFFRELQAGRPIPFYGDGSSRRDYTYIDDVVDGIRRAIDYASTPFEIINLGNHQTVSLAEMVETIGEVLGIRPVLLRLPPQPGDVPQTWADIGKAATLLGWRPRTTFRPGVESYRDWVKRPATARV